jgi:hypothetical protein
MTGNCEGVGIDRRVGWIYGGRGRWAGPVLLIVMYESQTWRVRPDASFTFGRDRECSAVLPAADRGVSRHAGSFGFRDGSWWLGNDSSSSVLCLLGDRGLRVDLPPGLQVPVREHQEPLRAAGCSGPARPAGVGGAGAAADLHWRAHPRRPAAVASQRLAGLIAAGSLTLPVRWGGLPIAISTGPVTRS